jgi:hypothetical protein
MYVGQTTTTRDLTPADAPAPAPVQAPAPAPQPADAFGPATLVEVKATAPAPVAAAGSPQVENVISIDQETRSVVFQSRNPDNGTVVFQLPDESKLKLRAYFDELAQHQTAVATAGTHPDPSQIDGIRV